jgi:membrane-associated phospholipid phosphatase
MMDYATLLRRTSIALAMTLVAVLICYFWVDRPVAFFVHCRHIDEIKILRWLTFLPPELQTWSPLLLTLLLVRRAWGPWLHWENVLFVAFLSVIVADQFCFCLGDVCGRYWPETWRHDNPSLIDTGTYGFHPFQRGDDIGSFPSGHAARILSFAMVWLIAMPGSRVILVVFALPMLISLVAMNYHFVGDVIAGSTLGGIIGTYATRLAQLRPEEKSVQRISRDGPAPA